MVALGQVLALHAIATSIEKRTEAERRATATLSFRITVACVLFLIYLFTIPSQVNDAFPEIHYWYMGEGGWKKKGSGYTAAPPAHATISPQEAVMAASYNTLYHTFGFLYGYKGSLSRRQALFVTEALSDLVFHPGFCGVQYSGSAKQLKRDKANYFLGISPDVPDISARVDRWFEKENVLACLYTSKTVLATNFAWNEAYTTAKNNGDSIDGTYMASLFEGGILNVAIEQVASEGDTNIHAYLHKLYGGSTYLAPKKCPAQGVSMALGVGIGVAGLAAGFSGGGEGAGAEEVGASSMSTGGMALRGAAIGAAGTGSYYAAKWYKKKRQEHFFKKKWEEINTCRPYENPNGEDPGTGG